MKVEISQWIAAMLWKLLMRSSYRLCLTPENAISSKIQTFSSILHLYNKVVSQRKAKKTVEKLFKLSVDIRKIRRLKKGWVLLEDETYVEEIANILQQLGANGDAVASILNILRSNYLPVHAINTQRELWQLVCKNEEELVKLIEQFPESFFTVKDKAGS